MRQGRKNWILVDKLPHNRINFLGVARQNADSIGTAVQPSETGLPSQNGQDELEEDRLLDSGYQGVSSLRAQDRSGAARPRGSDSDWPFDIRDHKERECLEKVQDLPVLETRTEESRDSDSASSRFYSASAAFES